MKKIFSICILFIFLFSFNKSDEEFDYEEYLKNLIDIIKEKKDQKLLEFINEQWAQLSYIKKNIIYQNIDVIKNNCKSMVYNQTKCKIIFDILGIL